MPLCQCVDNTNLIINSTEWTLEVVYKEKLKTMERNKNKDSLRHIKSMDNCKYSKRINIIGCENEICFSFLKRCIREIVPVD